MSSHSGTLKLIRTIVRLDRLRIALWVGGMALLVLTSASSVKSFYPNEAELAEAAVAIKSSAAQTAMNGPPQGVETYGGRIAWEIGAFGFTFVALMSMFLTGRQTRGEEESGRAELVRAAVVGRRAPITASLIVVSLVNVLLGAIVALGLIGLELPVTGSLTFAASMIAVGLVFAGGTALAAQMTEHTRTVYGLVGAALGAAFVIRAAGDATETWITWLSPLHWAQGTRSFAGERWWPLLLSFAFAGALVWAAYALAALRDLGAGLLQPRPGPASAPPLLSSPLGLALRLQRASLFWWSFGLLLTGLAYGSIGLEVDDVVGDNEEMREFLAQTGGNFTDAFFATSLLMLALIACGYTISSVLKLRTEESSYRAEPVLATATSRGAWAGSHVAVALVGTVVVVALAGIGTGLAFGAVSHDMGEVPRMLRAALAHLPAVWVTGGVAVALFGALPRASMLAWGFFAATIVITFFGPLFELPAWVSNLSPFTHTPDAPAEAVTAAPLLAMSTVAAALVAFGLATFRRRDVG